MIERTASISDLINRHGFAHIDIGIPKDESTNLFRMFDMFADILAEEPGGKLEQAVDVTLDGRGDSQHYFERRIKGRVHHREPHKGPSTYSRDAFHWCPATNRVANERLGYAMPTELSDFLGAMATAYYDYMRPAHYEAAKSLGLDTLLYHNEEHKERHQLTIFGYSSQTADHWLTRGHFDRSVTAISGELDQPGLQAISAHNGRRHPYTPDKINELEQRLAESPVIYTPGIGEFYLGAGYERIRDLHGSFEELPLLLHGVINTLGQGETRHAMVLFSNPHADVAGYQVPTIEELRLERLPVNTSAQF